MQVIPNQLVELHVETINGPQVFRTRVEDAHDDLVIVGAPLHRGSVVPIRVGTTAVIEFKLRGSVQEGRFRNTALVEKRFQANLPLLQLRLLGTWEKTQERMFVRVPVHLDALVIPKQDQDEEIPAAVSGVILNLSGGGFLLRTDHHFELDDEVNASFRLGTEQIVANAYVARIVPTEFGQDYGFAFFDIKEQLRQVIIQFVFKRQIELAEIAREERS